VKRSRGAFRGRPIALLALSTIACGERGNPHEGVLERAPTCTRCSISLERAATLGDDKGHVGNELLWMTMDSRGRVYVTWQLMRPGGTRLAAVFDSTGRFIREIGQRGTGPGEFNHPITLNVDAHGQLYIWEFDRRTTVLDSEYRFVRQFTQPAATNLILPDGRHLVNLRARDGANTLHPITVLDSLGNVIDAIGGTPLMPADTGEWRSVRLVAPGRDGTIWFQYVDRYRIEQWTADGKLMQTFTRRPEWWAEPIATRSEGGDGDEPTPVARGMRDDGAGRLWVMINLAKKDWRKALGPPRLVARSGARYTITSRPALYDTVIDVIDVERGTLLASQRFPEMMMFFLGDDLLASYREDVDGEPFIDLWRARFTRR
jgi:hypothetical protein